MSKERDRQDSRNNGKSSRNHDYLIKLRGISNSTNKDEIKDLLYRKLVCSILLLK